MNSNLTNDTQVIVQQYLLAKWDPEGYEERFGGGRTFREALEVIKQDYPDDYQQIAHMLVTRYSDRIKQLEYSPEELERQAAIKAVRQELNIDAPDFIDDGVLEGFGSIGDFKKRRLFPDVAKAKAATVAWLSGEGPPLLVLAGPPGVGKTHLAEGAAKQLQENGHEVIYREETDLISVIRRGMAPNVGDAHKLISAFSGALWLIVDDLGLAALTDTMRGVMDGIINARWRGAGGLRTMVTMNLKSKDIPPRIASRLGDKSRSLVVQIDAEDMRKEF